MDEVVGTIAGRWYVTLFGLTFAWRASRHMGWRRTAIYAVLATAVGALAENGSVHIGFPYTRYSFNEALRGDELFIGDVPLMVPLSYTFMGYFAFASGRLLASGPRRTRGRLWAEVLLAIILGVWALWILDPISRLGDQFYLGEVFAYDGPGFWFGLPFGSQLGFTLTAAVLVGLLCWLTAGEANAAVPGGLRRHPHLVALVTWHAQVFHLAVVAFVIGENTIGGAALIMWIPAAAIVAVSWSGAPPEPSVPGHDRAPE